jgi:hypothetical protein
MKPFTSACVVAFAVLSSRCCAESLQQAKEAASCEEYLPIWKIATAPSNTYRFSDDREIRADAYSVGRCGQYASYPTGSQFTGNYTLMYVGRAAPRTVRNGLEARTFLPTYSPALPFSCALPRGHSAKYSNAQCLVRNSVYSSFQGIVVRANGFEFDANRIDLDDIDSLVNVPESEAWKETMAVFAYKGGRLIAPMVTLHEGTLLMPKQYTVTAAAMKEMGLKEEEVKVPASAALSTPVSHPTLRRVRRRAVLRRANFAASFAPLDGCRGASLRPRNCSTVRCVDATWPVVLPGPRGTLERPGRAVAFVLGTDPLSSRPRPSSLQFGRTNSDSKKCRLTVNFVESMDTLVILYGVVQKAPRDPTAAVFFSELMVRCGCRCKQIDDVPSFAYVPVHGVAGECIRAKSVHPSVKCDVLGNKMCSHVVSDTWSSSKDQKLPNGHYKCGLKASKITRVTSTYRPAASFGRPGGVAP